MLADSSYHKSKCETRMPHPPHYYDGHFSKVAYPMGTCHILSLTMTTLCGAVLAIAGFLNFRDQAPNINIRSVGAPWTRGACEICTFHQKATCILKNVITTLASYWFQLWFWTPPHAVLEKCMQLITLGVHGENRTEQFNQSDCSADGRTEVSPV